jgi:chemotaxis protein MotB
MTRARTKGRRKNAHAVHENHERWLLTYADLITLLLAFFIVMYSMSRIDAKKFGAMSNALSGALSGQQLAMREKEIFANLQQEDADGGGALDTSRLRLMRDEIQKIVEDADIGEAVSSEVTERGLVIHIMEGALFEEASADLTSGARAVLRVVGEKIRESGNQVRIEGHTDPRPIHTARFPSNWELSTARATSVLRFVVDSIGVEPGRISALGFGEFRPMVPNDSPSNMAQNRRVDIVILSEKMTLSEPESTATKPDQNSMAESSE